MDDSPIGHRTNRAYAPESICSHREHFPISSIFHGLLHLFKSLLANETIAFTKHFDIFPRERKSLKFLNDKTIKISNESKCIFFSLETEHYFEHIVSRVWNRFRSLFRRTDWLLSYPTSGLQNRIWKIVKHLPGNIWRYLEPNLIVFFIWNCWIRFITPLISQNRRTSSHLPRS